MDQAIWATWYDLPEDGRDEYLDWLHGEYLPELQSKPGIPGRPTTVTLSAAPI